MKSLAVLHHRNRTRASVMKQPKLSENSDDGQAAQSSEALRMSSQLGNSCAFNLHIFAHMKPHKIVSYNEGAIVVFTSHGQDLFLC